MSIDIVKIDQTLEQLVLENKNRFNAYFVAHLSSESNVDEVNDYLLMKAKFGALKVMIETICPEGHVDKQYEFEKGIPNYEIECRFCDEEHLYIPDPDSTNIVFYFSEAFIDGVKKKAVLVAI